MAVAAPSAYSGRRRGAARRPHDTAAIAPTPGWLAADAALRTELCARGYARAARFTWERCARATLAMLEQALASHKKDTS